MKAVGRRVRQLREAQGLSQAALAKRAGVTKITVLRTERGYYSPSLSTLERLAKALGVKVKDLIPNHPKKRRKRGGRR